MALTELNKISIVDICFYTPVLFIAVLLSWRHSFGRSAGWLYLIIFSIARIMGGAFELATINSPDNISIYVGAQTLQTIGLSPLLLVMLGLITRVYMAMNEAHRPIIPNTAFLRLLQILVVVSLILSIVGGTDIGDEISDAIDNGETLGSGSFTYTIPTESKAGVCCAIVGYAFLVLSALILLLNMRNVPLGEKRLLGAVLVAAPFVLVRLLYSILSVFDANNDNFRAFGAGPNYANYVLGMCTLMEIVAVVIFESVGLSLSYVSRHERVRSTDSQAHDMRTYRVERGRPKQTV